ncbi:MAG: orotidine-5'-phosphate decarboxylase [Micrococcales bacterium]|nr:orotidine-5'-phosphate decarboxylase [Micrococcales bacterium]
MTTPFADRLVAAMDEHGPLAVGIDPHPSLLRAWGLADDVEGLRSFALGVVGALGGRVAALKPQSALFERHGSAGVRVLEEVIFAGRQAATLVIVDAKRGDVGSTMTGYADAYLRDGSPLAADAVTLSPYLGFGSLAPAVDAAVASGRGVFVLALTTNPEAAGVQHAVDASGTPVAVGVAQAASQVNAQNLGERGLGPVGLVVGATVGDAPARLGLDLAGVRGVLLAPGVGAQGAGPAELAQVFGTARHAVLASASRSVLGAGPDPHTLVEAARHAAGQAREALLP